MDAPNGRKPIPWTFILPFALTLAAGFLAVYRSFVSIQDITARQEKRIEALEDWKDQAKDTVVNQLLIINRVQEAVAAMKETEHRLEATDKELHGLVRDLSLRLERSGRP